MMKVEKKRVDNRGRVSLPITWRKRILGTRKDVLIIEFENKVEIFTSNADLEKYIDSVETETKSFEDYHELKKDIRSSLFEK